MKGSVVYADKKIVFRTEQGPVVLLAAGSKDFKQLGRFEQPDRSDRLAWAHPVIADGKLYLRDQDKLLVYTRNEAGQQVRNKRRKSLGKFDDHQLMEQINFEGQNAPVLMNLPPGTPKKYRPRHQYR